MKLEDFWIPITERFPEQWEAAFVWDGEFIYEVGRQEDCIFFDYENGIWMCGEYSFGEWMEDVESDKRPTHWFPIPNKPPEPSIGEPFEGEDRESVMASEKMDSSPLKTSLLPCPFCGSQASYRINEGTCDEIQAVCDSCWCASGITFFCENDEYKGVASFEEAQRIVRKAWNTRVSAGTA